MTMRSVSSSSSADWSRERDAPSVSGSTFAGSSASKRWCHTEEEVRQGVQFRVRYIGCLEVLASMRSMVFTDRAVVAKECINRVCEAAGMKTPSKKHKTERHIQQVLGLPNLFHAGEDVTLLVDVDKIQIISLDGRTLISNHELPEISFASGGDSETVDFIAYVGKGSERPSSISLPGRWCFVIECGAGVTQDCVSTIGQAFDLRFKQHQHMQNTTSRVLDAIPENLEANQARTLTRARNNQIVRQTTPVTAKMTPKVVPDTDYYNDMPGKTAPAAELAMTVAMDQTAPSSPQARHGEIKSIQLATVKAPDPNLIDLNSPHYDKSAHTQFQKFDLTDPLLQHMTENKDPFDLTNFVQLLQPSLTNYAWYHHNISRQNAEQLLKNNGDFLVRASLMPSLRPEDGFVPPQQKQYVLSGMHDGHKCHILLVDYDGAIRTRNQIFKSIPHLIEVHHYSQEPIISGDSEIFLHKAVDVNLSVK